MSPLTLCVFFLGIGSLGFCATVSYSGLCWKELKLNWRQFDNLPETDMQMKCFHHCLYAKYRMISEGKYVGTYKPCEGVQDDNNCELGFKVHNCLKLKSPQ